MMLISEDGITKIFPNWYEDKDAKFVNLRANPLSMTEKRRRQ